jgi:hypothetical protein
MSLDELRAAAERVIARPLTNVNDDDARAVATWVRDLLILGAGPDYADVAFAKPTRSGWVELDFDDDYQVVPPAAARAYAADLLRAAESAGSLPEARVHEREPEPHGRPGG